MKPLICNFKMHFTLSDFLSYKKRLEPYSYSNLILCPAYPFLALMHSKNYALGAQDVSESVDPFISGDVSAIMLKSLDVKLVLLNHSSRNEEKQIVKEKMEQALKNGITVCIFISETQEEHYYQYTKEKLMEQIAYYIEDIDQKDYPHIIFAYEPVWLIGKDKTLTVSTIKNLFYQMKKEMEYTFSYAFSLYYGGGLTSESIFELYSLPMVDGFVLGNLCLDVQNVIDILEKLKENKIRHK